MAAVVIDLVANKVIININPSIGFAGVLVGLDLELKGFSVDVQLLSKYIAVSEQVAGFTATTTLIQRYFSSVDLKLKGFSVDSEGGWEASGKIKGVKITSSLNTSTRIALTSSKFSVSSTLSIINAYDLEEEIYGFVVNSQLSITPTSLYGMCINTTNLANTEYSNYPFVGLAILNKRLLACNSTGIFYLDGNLDDEDYINTTIKITDLDLFKQYGDIPRSKKFIRGIRVTKRGDGDILVTVDAQGTLVGTYTSQVVSNDIHEERIDVGKGLQNRYITITIQNENGSDFIIDSLVPIVDIITEKR